MQTYKLGEGPYGSAYRGTIDDLFEAGDLKPISTRDRSFGLFLGHFDWQQSYEHKWQQPAKGLLAWLTGDRVDCSRTEVIDQIHDLRFTGDQHHLIVASSGAGKFRDVLSNMLLYDGSCETACLIIDPKGEVASVLGPVIDGPGAQDPRTIILDPWNQTGVGRTDSLNLLDGIRADNPHCVKDARVLAEALIVERGGDDAHWMATSRNFLAALLLYLALDQLEEGRRTLFRLREIVTEKWSEFNVVIAYMGQSELFNGLVARAATAMLNRDEKERRAIFSTLERDTAFIEDPSLWKAINSSSFDIGKLVLTNKRLHVIVPFDYTDQMSSWLRLTIAAFYNACLRNQLPRNLPQYLQFRHIIIDEFAGLGKLDFILKGIAEARGAGIKYHLVVQNFPQLNSLYRDGWESIVSNSFIHAFGINDNFTAEYLSKLTGQSTVVTESKGYSSSVTSGSSYTTGSSHSSTSGTSSSSSSGSSRSQTYSSSSTQGTSTTFASAGRPVLLPDEIRRISGSQQLLFMRGLPVFLTRRTPYFQTFQQFLPRHSLRDSLAKALAPNGKRSLALFGTTRLEAPGPLREVNSFIRPPSFSPPSFRPFTFKEALWQSPGILVAAACLALFVIWFVPYEISSAIEAHRQAIIDQADAEKAAAKAAEERQVAAIKAEADRKTAEELESKARAIDIRLEASYVPMAASVARELARQGLCIPGAPANPALSCTTADPYVAGSLAPLKIGVTAHRQIFATLAFSPHNELREDSFSGVSAEVKVTSVFEHIDMDDETRFPPALRMSLLALLHAFNVSDQAVASCMTQGESEESGGTSVICSFAPRPQANGGLAQFTMTLERPL